MASMAEKKTPPESRPPVEVAPPGVIIKGGADPKERKSVIPK